MGNTRPFARRMQKEQLERILRNFAPADRGKLREAYRRKHVSLTQLEVWAAQEQQKQSQQNPRKRELKLQ